MRNKKRSYRNYYFESKSEEDSPGLGRSNQVKHFLEQGIQKKLQEEIDMI